MLTSNPLVSVIVITYNSENYILDALESIKNQTYRNIELIISDDCSTDSTVTIVEKWLLKNGSFFKSTKLVTSTKNTGIAANCNRGLINSNGEWIKFLAGDDSLENDYIDLLIKYAKENQEIKVIHGPVYAFNFSFTPKNFIGILFPDSKKFIRPSINSIEQFKILLKKCVVFSPSVFIHRSVFDKIGFFDEEMPVEDWPMWLMISKAGYKFFYYDVPLVKYRIHSNSLTYKNERYLFNSFLLFVNEEVYKKYIRREIKFFRKVLDDLKFLFKKRIISSKYYIRNFYTESLYRFIKFLYKCIARI